MSLIKLIDCLYQRNFVSLKFWAERELGWNEYLSLVNTEPTTVVGL